MNLMKKAFRISMRGAFFFWPLLIAFGWFAPGVSAFPMAAPPISPVRHLFDSIPVND
jgi:hypothetical protein